MKHDNRQPWQILTLRSYTSQAAPTLPQGYLVALGCACTDIAQVAGTRQQQPGLTIQLQHKSTWSIAIQQRVVRVVACCDASHMSAMGAGVHHYGQHVAVIIDVEGKVAAIHRAECGISAGVMAPPCLQAEIL